MPRNPEVDKFIIDSAHPLMEEIERVREIILDADDRVEEAIKWKSPTFMYKGNIASYFFNAKKFVSLMFHKGAFLKDPNGILEGDGKEARVARFNDMQEIESKKDALQGLIKEWIKIQDV